MDVIEKALIRFPKAKRIAVENFTMSCDSFTKIAEYNLVQDSIAYKWNKDTIHAIISVLNEKGNNKE